MELKVTPICGRDYSVLDKHGTVVKKDLFGGKDCRLPSYRGICWNPLTRCLLVCDIEHCCVYSYAVSFCADETGEMTMVFNHNNPAMAIGNHGSSPGQFNHPVAVAVNLRGEIAIADGKLNRVQIFSGSGELEHGFGRPGSARGEFKGISDLKFTPRGHVAIVDSGNHRIQVVSATGNVVQVIGRYGWKIGQFINPCALTVNGKGEYFVCDEGNKRIQRLSDRGRPLLEWGSHRGPTPEPETITITATNDELRPVIYSVFGAPCDVVVGLHGEIIVCDAGRRELLVFSDAGVCLHVVSAPHIFENNSPAAIAICSSMLATIATTLPEENLKADLRRDVQAVCILAVFPPDKRVRVGRFEPIPVHCAVQIVSCITYYDALHLRLVNRYFHQICRRLRNQWNLFPLTQGNATIMKYNRVVAPATGLIAVEEAFQKWGLRIYKPSNRIRKHVMDFQGGFCSALSMLYGPMFCYQYEDVLLALFRFYACPHSEEIDKAAFIEIVTQIEEVCSNLRTWEQCTPFSRCTANAVLLPTIKPAESESLTTRGVSLPTSLQHVENAQQHQLDKLLQKLKTL